MSPTASAVIMAAARTDASEAPSKEVGSSSVVKVVKSASAVVVVVAPAVVEAVASAVVVVIVAPVVVPVFSQQHAASRVRCNRPIGIPAVKSQLS